MGAVGCALRQVRDRPLVDEPCWVRQGNPIQTLTGSPRLAWTIVRRPECAILVASPGELRSGPRLPVATGSPNR